MSLRALRFVLLAGMFLPLSRATGQSQLHKGAEEIIDLARVVPPAFGADAILALLESGLVRDERRKLDLLEDAFEMAGSAHFPRKLAYHFGHADTREGLLDDAYKLKLDTESLRCRVVRALVRLRPRAARDLFERTASFSVPPHGCHSALTYDPTEIFEALATVVSEGFDASERRRGLDVDFVERYVGVISSPVQSPPAARLIVRLGFSRDALERLVGAYSAALRRMPADDRAFRDGYDLIEALDPLAEACYRAGAPVAPLVEAARRHIVANLQGVRCADSARRAARTARQAEGQEAVVAKWNQWKARKPPYVSREAPPIRAEEARPAKVVAGPDNPEYWTTPKGATLLASLQRLRFGPRQPGDRRRHRPALSLEVRKTPEWFAEMSDVLREVEAWKLEKGEDEVAYFVQRSLAYLPLVELAPEGPARDLAIQGFVAFLANFPLQRTQPVLWYVPAAELLNLLRRSSVSAAGVEQRSKRDVEWALRQFERSGSLVLTLRAKLDAVLPKRDR